MKKKLGFLLVGILCVAALYHGIKIQHYTITSDKLTEEQSFHVAIITDLHSHIYGRDQTPLLKKVLQEQPDAVFLVGDIYDNVIPPEGVRLLLAGLRDKVPLFYVTGNHEYWTHDMESVLALFKEYGVAVLQDQWKEVVLNGVPIVIGGVCDPVRAKWEKGYDPYAAMEQGFADLPENKFSILLAHRPTWFDRYSAYPFDLVVSGHNHGGQVRIPFLLNGLYGPDEGFFPEYPGGIYQEGGKTLIVSRGLSVNLRLPRVWNPPELVILHVKGKPYT